MKQANKKDTKSQIRDQYIKHSDTTRLGPDIHKNYKPSHNPKEVKKK